MHYSDQFMYDFQEPHLDPQEDPSIVIPDMPVTISNPDKPF